MSAVDLSFLPVLSAEPVPIENGRVLKPALNAPLQRIQRLGNKNALVITTAAISEGRQARFVRKKLAEARRDGALFEWPQDDIRIMWSTPTIAAEVLSGNTLTITGMGRGQLLEYGQAISVIVDEQRYLDFVESNTSADQQGNATVQIQNLIRVPIPAGAKVELVGAMIEGTIEGFSGGTFGIDGTTSFTFTITEDA